MIAQNPSSGQPVAKVEDNQDQLALLLEKNLLVSQEILELSRYIKSYVRWQKIFGWVKTALVVIPLVIGLLYLPSLLDNTLASYGLSPSTLQEGYNGLLK